MNAATAFRTVRGFSTRRLQRNCCRRRVRLFDASQGNADLAADISPIRALLEQGCDLQADVVPIVARELPELPRPLTNWGAPWLVREILAARDQRLAGQPVEAPPPAPRPSSGTNDPRIRTIDKGDYR